MGVGRLGHSDVVTPLGGRVWTYILDVAGHPIVERFIVDMAAAVSDVGRRVPLLRLRRRADRLRRTSTRPALVDSLARDVTDGAISLVALRGVVWWALGQSPWCSLRSSPRTSRTVTPTGPSESGRDGRRGRALRRRTHPELGRTRRSGGPAMLTFAPEQLTEALREEVPPGARVFEIQTVPCPLAEFSAMGSATRSTLVSAVPHRCLGSVHRRSPRDGRGGARCSTPMRWMVCSSTPNKRTG